MQIGPSNVRYEPLFLGRNRKVLLLGDFDMVETLKAVRKRVQDELMETVKEGDDGDLKLIINKIYGKGHNDIYDEYLKLLDY